MKMCPLLSTKQISSKEGKIEEIFLEVQCQGDKCFFWTNSTCVFMDRTPFNLLQAKVLSSLDKGFSDTGVLISSIKQEITEYEKKFKEREEQKIKEIFEIKETIKNTQKENIEKIEKILTGDLKKTNEEIKESINKIKENTLQEIAKFEEFQKTLFAREESLNRFLQSIENLIQTLKENLEKIREVSIKELISLHYEKALFLSLKGDFISAKEELEKIFDFEPENLQAKLLYASCLIEEGEKEKSLEILENILKQRKDIKEVYNNLGVIYMEQGKLNESLEVFLKGKELAKNYPELLFNMGNCLYKLGRVKEAIETWKESLMIEPSFLPAKEAIEKYSKGI